jgi:uncharacterized protein (DUF849 family)
MSWEALTAISTAFTGLVIRLTVIFAARQVRELNKQSEAMSAQLEHLRRATQLDGTMKIMDELTSPDVVDAYRFLLTEFEGRMLEKSFHDEAVQRAPDVAVHKELHILRHLERVGTLIKNRLLDPDVLLDFSCGFISECWTRLETLVCEQRDSYGNPHLWENFECIAMEARRYLGQYAPPSRADR